MLLVLVYGVFLVLVGITAGALVMVSSAHLSSATLAATVARDGAMVELALNRDLLPGDLDGEVDVARRAALESDLGRLAGDAGFLRIEVRSPAGAALLTSVGTALTPPPIAEADWATALGGSGSVTLVDDAGLPVGVVQELLPLATAGGELRAVVAVWRDAAPVLARLDAARRDIMLVTLAAALILAALLFAVFRAAQARIWRQQAMLRESERRDPLTGLLNHGAVVGIVAELLEARRAAGGALTVALVDVDNFRLLNETHGTRGRRRGAQLRGGDDGGRRRSGARCGPGVALRPRRVPARVPGCGCRGGGSPRRRVARAALRGGGAVR
jgi:hypothetical protein